ncbi:hypothetical protein D3C80_1256890 [compost metagenome]
MADAEGVVLALGTAREGGDAVLLAQAAHRLAATGEDLVRIGLMADVPHQTVVGCVEDVMQGDRQLDNAQAGTEMSASLAYRIEQLLAQFIGQGVELRFTQPTQAGRGVGAV